MKCKTDRLGRKYAMLQDVADNWRYLCDRHDFYIIEKVFLDGTNQTPVRLGIIFISRIDAERFKLYLFCNYPDECNIIFVFDYRAYQKIYID